MPSDTTATSGIWLAATGVVDCSASTGTKISLPTAAASTSTAPQIKQTMPSQVLEQLHALFFAAADPGAQDARVLLRGMRERILQGCTLLFSAVFPRFAVPEHDFHWQLAEKVQAYLVDT